jgi:hypothetical protein
VPYEFKTTYTNDNYFMANHFRIILDIWSSRPEPLYCFLGGLVSEGWYAHCPVPDRRRSPDRDGDIVIRPEINAWGAYLFPDMRILTAAGLVEVCEPGKNLPRLAARSVEERKAQLNKEIHPGFIGPARTDTMISVIAESRAGVPFRWFTAVFDMYYGVGLRCFAVVYDHVDASYGGADGRLFYSVSSDFECDLDKVDGRSLHCIGLTVPDYIHGSLRREGEGPEVANAKSSEDSHSGAGDTPTVSFFEAAPEAAKL